MVSCSRRTFMLGASAATALAAAARAGLGVRAANAEGLARPNLYAAARQDATGRHSAAIFGPDGVDIRSIPLPGRGHDIAVCPATGRCAVFARRPGLFAFVFDASQAPPVVISTPANRHFYGHGVFSADGRLLYATENDFAAGRGVIGVYDVALQFRRIGELPSYGVGPHDMGLLPGAPVLVVANGGLREDPRVSDGRAVLNQGNVTTSLAYVDLATGDLLERHQLSQAKGVSLRHFDITANGTVVLGAQSLAPADTGVTLLFKHQRQQDLQTLLVDEPSNRQLKGYVSSIAFDRAGETVAITSSRGNRVLLLNLTSGEVFASHSFADISGVAAASGAGQFMLTSGYGAVAACSPSMEPAKVATNWHWDNHAAALPGGASA